MALQSYTKHSHLKQQFYTSNDQVRLSRIPTFPQRQEPQLFICHAIIQFNTTQRVCNYMIGNSGPEGELWTSSTKSCGNAEARFTLSEAQNNRSSLHIQKISAPKYWVAMLAHILKILSLGNHPLPIWQEAVSLAMNKTIHILLFK